MSDIRQNRIELNEVHIARSMAIFLVVLLHSSGAFFMQFGDHWWIVNLYSSFSRQCIGLFFLITGYLFYEKNINPTAHLKKGVSRLIIPFIFWWVVYYIYNTEINNKSYNSIFQPSEVHLWFMYAYICIYMFLPIICNSLKHIPTYYILIIVSMLFYSNSIVPVVDKTIMKVTWFDVKLVSENGIYILIGAIIRRYNDKIKKCNAVIPLVIIVMSCLLTSMASSWWSEITGRPEQFFFKNTSPLVLICVISSFTLCMSYSKIISKRLMNLFTSISNVSFGIYFVHFFFVREIRLGYNQENAYFMIPLLTIIYFLMSYCISIIISKIPLLRKVI